MAKNLELAFYYNFGAFGAVLLQFWRRRRFFFTQFWRLWALFKAPKALFIINFGAEGAFYCQRRFVKTLCIVL